MLQRFIGATTRELFETMFGLNHSALLAGGKALLEGRGELGESLFGASLGLHSIHSMRTELERQATEIFAPRGKNPALNRALTRFKDAKKTIADATLRPREWQEKQQELSQIEEQLQQLEQQHRVATTKLSRLQRLQRVLPNLHQYHVLLQQKQSLGEVNLVAPNGSEQRQQAQQILQRTESQKTKYLAEQQRCQQNIERLQIPETLLTQGEALEELRDSLARYRAAQRDQPNVQEKLATTLDEVSAILRDLGQPVDLDLKQAQQLIISVAAQTRVRQLSQQGIKLSADLERTRQDLVLIEQQHSEQSQQLAQLRVVEDTTPLRQLLTEINKQGDLSEQLQQLSLTLNELEQQSEKLFAGITLWQRDAQALSQLVLPLPETITRYEHYYQRLENEQQRVALRKETAHQQLADVDARIDALKRQGEVPSDAGLQQARASRDEHWQRLREAWRQNRDETALQQQLAIYEDKVVAADTAADELRKDAERAAQYANFSAEQARWRNELSHIDAMLQDLSAEAEILTEQWHQVWQSCAIEPLSPSEMKRWVERQQRWLEIRERQQQQQQLVEVCRSKIETYQERLRQTLIASDAAPANNANLEFNAQLQHAETQLQRLEDIANTYQQTQRDLLKLAATKNTHKQALTRCQQALDDWQQHWQQALQPLGLSATATAAEAEAVLHSINQLADKLKDAQRYQLRIEQMRQYSEQFHQRVASFCQQYAADLQDVAVEEAVLALNQRLNQGNSDLREYETLTQRLQQIEQELRELKTEQDNATATLQKLMNEAAVTTLEALQQAEQRSQQYRELSAKLDHLEQQLGRESLSISELEQQAQTIDSDALPGEVQTLALQVDDLTQQLQQYHQQKGRLETELMALENHSGAADAALDAQTALAEIKIQVENYMRVKLCGLILHREIERYREQHQGPIMQRASELFRRMTLDSFSGLRSGFDDADQLVLRCQRADGETVAVEGLSEGSRDQLYLALRLASLELQAQQADSLPLIVDDVLINFDDERATATLEILAELAVHTQILFFTHHARLLELAQDTIPEPELQIMPLARSVK